MPNWADVGTGLKHAWDAFRGRDAPATEDYGAWTGSRPYRAEGLRRGDKSIITAIYNRIAIDVAAVALRHAYTDINGKYVETIFSRLNETLTVEANLDQSGRQFIQDLVYSMLDEGVVAAVPVETDLDPTISASYDIFKLRVGKILAWYPQHVKVRVYDEKTGQKRELIRPKRTVAIIENPMYEIMNGQNSMLQRLLRKLNLMDSVDEQASRGKLDMIIQLPFPVRSETQRRQAEDRRNELERQLNGSSYGIAYTGATEKIVQLNRSLENNLLKQVEYLTDTVYGQLGITAEVMNGTADDKAMLYYHNRMIEPILSAITGEFNRKFLTKRARNRGESIVFTRDPFRLVPVNDLANIADVFTRNEILTSNEFRGILGFTLSDDPRADQLINSNNVAYGEVPMPTETVDAVNQNGPVGPLDEPQPEEGPPM